MSRGIESLRVLFASAVLCQECRGILACQQKYCIYIIKYVSKHRCTDREHLINFVLHFHRSSIIVHFNFRIYHQVIRNFSFSHLCSFFFANEGTEARIAILVLTLSQSNNVGITHSSCSNCRNLNLPHTTLHLVPRYLRKKQNHGGKRIYSIIFDGLLGSGMRAFVLSQQESIEGLSTGDLC